MSRCDPLPHVLLPVDKVYEEKETVLVRPESSGTGTPESTGVPKTQLISSLWSLVFRLTSRDPVWTRDGSRSPDSVDGDTTSPVGRWSGVTLGVPLLSAHGSHTGIFRQVPE